MPMAADDIERLIVTAIPDADVTIRDLAGDGDHYAARVVARSFAGMTRIRQHQAVYAALGGRVVVALAGEHPGALRPGGGGSDPGAGGRGGEQPSTLRNDWRQASLPTTLKAAVFRAARQTIAKPRAPCRFPFAEMMNSR